MSSDSWDYKCPQFVDFTQGTGDQEDSFLDATVFINELEVDNGSANEVVSNFEAAAPLNINTSPSPTHAIGLPANFTDSQKMKVMSKRISRSLNDINLAGASSQESLNSVNDYQVNARGQRVRKRSISACELKLKKLTNPVTPNCLKRGKSKSIKTTEERELDKIAELRKQLADHLKMNKAVMRKNGQKQFPAIKLPASSNSVKPPLNFRQRGQVPNVANAVFDKKRLNIEKNIKAGEPCCSKNLPPNFRQRGQVPNAANAVSNKKGLNIEMNMKAIEPCCSKNLPPNFKHRGIVPNAAHAIADKKGLNNESNTKVVEPCWSKNLPPNFRQRGIVPNAASAIIDGKQQKITTKDPRNWGHIADRLRSKNPSIPSQTITVKEKNKAAAAANAIAQINKDVFNIPTTICNPHSDIFKMPDAKNVPHVGMKFSDKRKKPTVHQPFSFDVESRLNKSVSNVDQKMLKQNHSKSMVAEDTNTENFSSVKKVKANILTKSEKPKRSKSIVVHGNENRKENFIKQRAFSASERVLKDNNILNFNETSVPRVSNNTEYTFRKPYRPYDYSALLSNPPKADK